MDFLSLALQCSFLPITVSQEPTIELDMPGIVLAQGIGDGGKSGDRVTIDFIVRDQSGKEIANSLIRGVPHTFDILSIPGDILLNGVAIKGRSGEERMMFVESQAWYGETSPFSLIRASGTLLVWVRIAKIERR